MIGIVQPDGDELADLADAGAKPQPLLRGAVHQRQRLRVDVAKSRKAVGRQGLPGDIADMAGKVAHPTGFVQQAGLLGPGSPIAQKFHSDPSFLRLPAGSLARAPGAA